MEKVINSANRREWIIYLNETGKAKRKELNVKMKRSNVGEFTIYYNDRNL